MFMDFRDQVPPPPWEPRPVRRAPLSPGQRKTVEWIVAFNALMLLCGPLAGATILEGIVALLR